MNEVPGDDIFPDDYGEYASPGPPAPVRTREEMAAVAAELLRRFRRPDEPFIV